MGRLPYRSIITPPSPDRRPPEDDALMADTRRVSESMDRSYVVELIQSAPGPSSAPITGLMARPVMPGW